MLYIPHQIVSVVGLLLAPFVLRPTVDKKLEGLPTTSWLKETQILTQGGLICSKTPAYIV